MKRFLPILIILVLLFQTAVFAETPIRIFLNDTQLALSSQPLVVSGVTLVPISDILRPIGADIGWDSVTRTATIKKDGKEIIIIIGQNTATVNGQSVNMALPARIQNGRTMIPLRFVSESLGYYVQWDGVNRQIFVDTRIQSGAKLYGDGMYKVGTDLEIGLYKILAGDYSYVEGAKDSKGILDSINWNGTYKQVGYFEVMPDDAYITVKNGLFFKYDKAKSVENFKSQYGDGIYLVGIDIKPGEYKVDAGSDNFGYVHRSTDVNGDIDALIMNEIYSSTGYITILPTDYTVQINGCVLTPVQ